MYNLIINADDFGLTSEINAAVLRSMDQQLCMDTTLLVNFPSSEEAATLAAEQHKKELVGIHLNLTEGRPLTTGILREPRFCNAEGFFYYQKQERIYALSFSEKKAVYEELTAQVRQCRRFGIPISHADSHNHVHEEPALFFLMRQLMRQEKIPFLRLTKNLGQMSLSNQLYRNTYNTFITWFGLAGSHYFGSTDDFRRDPPRQHNGEITELMIHPGAIEDGHVIDSYTGENLSRVLPEILKGNQLIAYHLLKP